MLEAFSQRKDVACVTALLIGILGVSTASAWNGYDPSLPYGDPYPPMPRDYGGGYDYSPPPPGYGYGPDPGYGYGYGPDPGYGYEPPPLPPYGFDYEPPPPPMYDYDRGPGFGYPAGPPSAGAPPDYEYGGPGSACDRAMRDPTVHQEYLDYVCAKETLEKGRRGGASLEEPWARMREGYDKFIEGMTEEPPRPRQAPRPIAPAPRDMGRKGNLSECMGAMSFMYDCSEFTSGSPVMDYESEAAGRPGTRY